MSVHYKFKSNLDYDTITFDGLGISVADLKKSIMHQKKMGQKKDFVLHISNAITKQVYENDEQLIPKNSSVIVARVPLPIDDDLGQIRYDRIVKNDDLVNANPSEEDKIKAMITKSSSESVKSRSMTGRLPPTYKYFRSPTPGHWIKNCPTNNPCVKRSTGIPRSFLVPVDGPEHRGALLTSSGDYAVPLIDHQAYKEVKKEKTPFLPQEEPVAEPEAQIPEELLCKVCKDLLQDAVLIFCCGNSFCDECIRQVLLESDNHECPECQEADVSPDTLIPNRYLRRAVYNFKNQTGYIESDKPALVVKIETPSPPAKQHEDVGLPSDVGETSQPAASPKPSLDEVTEDIRPGAPLLDNLPVYAVHPPLPIQTIGQEQYRHPSHRSVFYTGRHSYTPPHFGASYQYGPAPAIDIPVLRTKYPPHHVHPIHPVPQSLHSRPIEREPRCPPLYNEMYPMYDVYPHQRYDQEQRPPRYNKRQEYQKDHDRQHPEVITHRIPGYIGERPRDYKKNYRQPRKPRKEIIREHCKPSRPDRRRTESSSQSRNVRHYGRESMQVVKKSRRVENVPRSRSRSYESIESHNSFKRKHIRQHGVHSEEPACHKSSREHSQSEPSESKSKRKHSPIKLLEKHTSESDRVKKQGLQRDYHDDLEFEPDYEPYSDIEEKE